MKNQVTSGVYLLAVLAVACGESSANTGFAGMGGAAGVATGGTGALGAGGGGASTGGASGDGGAATGGSSGDGGTSAGGGTSGDGGTSAGGGTSGDGGTSASGGTSGDGGAGGSPSGGGGGTGGASAKPGELDPSFGQGGILLGAEATGFAKAADVHDAAILPDGRVILAGAKIGATYGDFLFARFNANGSLDVSKTDDIGNHVDVANAVTVLASGKIVLAGSANNGLVDRFGVIRYLASGAIDVGFDGDGKVLTGIGSEDRAWDVAGIGEEVIAVGETSGFLGNTDFCIVRYTSAGKLQPTFHTDGIVTIDLGNQDIARAVAIDSNGRIVVAGDSGSKGIGVVRLNADGSLDQTFGKGGKKLISTSATSSVRAVTTLPSGKIVIAAQLGKDFLAVRLGVTGNLDTSFSTDGLSSFDYSSDDSPRDAFVDSDGKVVLAGSAIQDGNSGPRMSALRFATNGALDFGFGEGGLSIHGTSGSSDERAYASRELSDGYLIAGAKLTSSGKLAVLVHKIVR